MGVPRQQDGRQGGVPQAAAAPEPQQPASLAAHGGGGELSTAEMPGRAARMHAAPQQADWRDWGAGLPGNPAERAWMAEVKLAKALAVLDIRKAPGPGTLSSAEKYRTGEAARAAYPLMRLRDVTKTPSIPKSTHLDQRGAARQARPQDAAQGQGVRRSRGAAGPSARKT